MVEMVGWEWEEGRQENGEGGGGRRIKPFLPFDVLLI